MNNTQLFDLKSCEWNLFPILERFTLYLHSNKDNQLFPLMNLRFLLLLIIVQPTVEDLSLVEEEIEVAELHMEEVKVLEFALVVVIGRNGHTIDTC
jgi:hypothetical protein